MQAQGIFIVSIHPKLLAAYTSACLLPRIFIPIRPTKSLFYELDGPLST